VAAACLAGLLLVIGATLARADDLPVDTSQVTSQVPTDPGPICRQQTQQALCDNDYTPIAKEPGLWSPIQGARYDASGPETRAQYEARQAQLEGSPNEQVTSFDDELTDVAFQNTRNGFAAGQRKVDCNSDGTPDTYVPVIYRYGDSQSGLRWHKPSQDEGGLLDDCEHPGFVGQVTWIRTTGMALAVGGTGSYPYREPAYGKDIAGKDCAPDPDKPFGANCDQAGIGRAWLYNHGHWQELDHNPTTFPKPSAPNAWDGVRGMTALEFSPLPGRNFGFVGGLGQIWPVLVKISGQNGACEAEDANACVSFPADGKVPVLGGAMGKFDMNSNEVKDGPGDTSDAFRFRFRVRQLRMGTDGVDVGAAAVTDGCCAGDPDPAAAAAGKGASLGSAHNYPSLIAFDSRQSTLGSQGWGWQIWSFDPYGQAYEDPAYYGLSEGQRRQLPPPNLRPDMPDSFYSVGFSYGRSAVSGNFKVSVVASPGGPGAPEGAPERPSLVSGPICLNGDRLRGTFNSASKDWVDLLQPDQPYAALRSQLSSVRLVDGDGDDLVAYTNPVVVPGVTPVTFPPFAGAPSNAQRNTSNQTCSLGGETRQTHGGDRETSDAVPDWSVGELRSSERPGLGARGLAFSTVSRPTLIPETLDVGLYGESVEVDPSHILGNPAGYRPTTQEKLQAYLQSQYFFTGSYALNAIDYLDHSGGAWAVGAHGGIVQLGGASEGGLTGKKTADPSPPSLGTKRPGKTPDRGPYEQFAPTVTAPDEVPALAARPRQLLAQPALSFAGAPDATPDYGGRLNNLFGQIVMSRDGSEGWGLDRSGSVNGNSITTLFHYNGDAWGRCDPEGIDGVLAADRACEQLAPLRNYTVKGKARGVSVAAATRVPLENDGDPANDNEFEMLALGTGYRTPDEDAKAGAGFGAVWPTLLRYRHGAWRLDDDQRVRQFIGKRLGGSAGESYSSFSNYIATPDSGLFSGGLALAFASPTDGWLIDNGGGEPSHLLHFDGRRWVDCTTDRLADPNQDRIGDPKDSGTIDSTNRSGSSEDRKSWCDDPGALTIAAEGQVSTDAKNATSQDIDHFAGLTSVGDRLYLYGSRSVGGTGGTTYPLILCKDAGGSWRSEGCGLDPGFAVRHGTASQGTTGAVGALSVATDGSGWAVAGTGGKFVSPGTTTSLLRFGDEGWAPYTDQGPLQDRSATDIVALPGDGGILTAGNAFLRFEPDIGRWRYLPADLYPGGVDPGPGSSSGKVQGMGADGQGGAWIGLSNQANDLLHYTPRPPTPVFDETPSPLSSAGETFTSLAGEPNGTLWATSAGPDLYRYERTTGWDRVPIPGWQAPRATVAAAANAVAVNDRGVGVVVGREGRIADIAGSSVQLDGAAGKLCDLADVIPPCGTSRHLLAASVAPDGSAIAGGEYLSLLWRPAGGGFRAIEKPEAASSSYITGVSLPESGVAYLTTTDGQVFRGELAGDHWKWALEDTDQGESLLTRDPTGARAPSRLYAVAVDASGHGYAVGAGGMLLERSPRQDHPWRRIRAGVSATLTSIVMRDGRVLIGGADGLVLTGSGDRFAVARPADQQGGSTGAVRGLALSGGVKPGQTEAWAMTQGPASAFGGSVSRLFHYASDPAEPLLNPARSDLRAQPLSDVPPPRQGELSFAALGKVDCHLQSVCPGIGNVGRDYVALSRQIAEQIAHRAGEPNPPALALFTGDLVDEPESAGQTDAGARKLLATRTWIAEPLQRAGLGFYGALGSQDLTGFRQCVLTGCLATKQLAKAGSNDAWRQAFAGEAAPWGSGDAFASDRYEARPISDAGELYLDNQQAGIGGGARTHYAFDLFDKQQGKAVARFAIADNSLHSLAVSDPVQRPVESDSGQSGWLDRVLCFKGEAANCSREQGQPALVVANVPTYSYAKSDPTQLATDAATFESQLLRDKVTALISGSLGWNGLYYTCASGLHDPQPGGTYPDGPPQAGGSGCGQVADSSPQASDPTGTVGKTVNDLQGQVSPTGLFATIVASGAGGKFSNQAGGGAPDGFWHGYSLVRVPADGDPAKIVVEQRPLTDLLEVTAKSHVLRSGQKLALQGVGREPITYDSSYAGIGGLHTAAFNPIDNAAITHCYDLVLADPEKPWLPLRADEASESDKAKGGGQGCRSRSSAPAQDDECLPYVCVNSEIGTIDPQSGEVQAESGSQERTFALAILSVGEKVATYPLVFEPRPSFRQPPPPPTIPPPPAQVPPPAPAPPAPAPPFNPPTLAAPPPLVPLPAQTPPVPPVPPAPPNSGVGQLDLFTSPPVLSVAPSVALFPPSAPVINVAPPTPARPVEKAKKVAVQSSGSDSGADEKASSGRGAPSGGDLANAPAEMTRHDPHAFTAIAHRDQASAWARDLQWGGGLTLMAMVLAFGWITVRPKPRRREPEVPAPARASVRRR
jgi:hypothetical protein